MTDLVLDTHIAFWYLASDARLSRLALEAIRGAVSQGNRRFVPSICLVEATYLVESGSFSHGFDH